MPWRQRDKKSSRATAHAAICHKEYLEKVREAGRNGSTMVTVKQVNKCVEKMSRCKELTVWPLLLLVLSCMGYHSVTPEFVAPGVSYEMVSFAFIFSFFLAFFLHVIIITHLVVRLWRSAQWHAQCCVCVCLCACTRCAWLTQEFTVKAVSVSGSRENIPQPRLSHLTNSFCFSRCPDKPQRKKSVWFFLPSRDSISNVRCFRSRPLCPQSRDCSCLHTIRWEGEEGEGGEACGLLVSAFSLGAELR